MNGFLNLLKPPGMSSAAAVGFVRRLTGEKTGHAGTLDPEACGVLPVMIGRATRVLPYFQDKSKEYIAEICFSCATDTQDAQGKMTVPGAGMPDESALRDALQAFTGVILQLPPAYSAIKRDGRPLYALARQGQLVETEPRETEIRSIELMDIRPPDAARLRIVCGTGTYIRTLCHDIGAYLGRPAHMRLLIRSRSGCFALKDSHTPEEAEQAARAGALPSLLRPMDEPVRTLRQAEVSGKLLLNVLNGVRPPAARIAAEEGELFRICALGEWIALGERQGDTIQLPLILTDQKDFLARHPL